MKKRGPYNRIAPYKKRGSIKNRRTTESFIQEAIDLHGNLYDYSLAEYIGGHVKTKIICKKHGIFELSPSGHLRKGQPLRGCQKCAIERRVTGRTKTQEQFIIDAQKIHGETYDYSLVEYKDSCTPIIITCKKHRQFKQNPVNHLEGYGCNDCGRDRTTELAIRIDKEDWINKATAIHKNKYDYSKIEIVSSYKNIPITCPTHGLFVQNPYVHLRGSGCPKCSNNTSHMSQAWLDSLDIPDTSEYREVRHHLSDGSLIVADGFKDNTIYEFYGDFYHGNPDVKRLKPNDINPVNKMKYKDLYLKTKNREERIINSGFELIVMWEKDWLIKESKEIKNVFK